MAYTFLIHGLNIHAGGQVSRKIPRKIPRKTSMKIDQINKAQHDNQYKLSWTMINEISLIKWKECK